jgi:hypothetical protein
MKCKLLLLIMAFMGAGCSSVPNIEEHSTPDIVSVTVQGKKLDNETTEPPIVVIQGEELNNLMNSRWVGSTDSVLASSQFSKTERKTAKFFIVLQAGEKCTGNYSVMHVDKDVHATQSGRYQEIWTTDMCGKRRWLLERGEKDLATVQEIE